MPIKIADSLPAKDILENENIFVMTEYVALHQDIRPLKLLILNLMPTKIITETQLLRKLSNTPLQIEVEFLQTISHEAKNVDAEHLESFYTSFDKVKHTYYDAMIITGAPVENLDFTDVDYWPELCRIMAWTKHNVHSTFHICWGAQAGLYYHYGIDKYQLPKKLSGVFKHRVLKPQSPFFRGFDDEFYVPPFQIYERPGGGYPEGSGAGADVRLERMPASFAVKSEDNRRFFITGHPEYDPETLALEYARDVQKGLDTRGPPKTISPATTPAKTPVVTWRAPRPAPVHQLAQLLRLPGHPVQPRRHRKRIN